MSAETLRRAATLMRERAEAASGGGKWPWKAEPDTMAGRVWVQMSRTRWLRSADCEPLFNVRSEDGYAQREADAAHIASWHPAVALAVAVLLVDAAEALESQLATGDDPAEDVLSLYGSEIAVARAYLGEAP